jgi:hypothetical protein
MAPPRVCPALRSIRFLLYVDDVRCVTSHPFSSAPATFSCLATRRTPGLTRDESKGHASHTNFTVLAAIVNLACKGLRLPNDTDMVKVVILLELRR